MIYLTPQQVLFIHARLVAETGGANGIRDLGLLAAAVARPQATFDGNDLYPDLYHKAAALIDSIVRNHPFLDGNKRTGITAAGLFPRLNGRRLTVDNDTLEASAVSVAQSKISVSEMAAWFQQHSEPQE